MSDLAQLAPTPDTGSLRDDLLACAHAFEHNARTQAVLAGLMTAMARRPELRDSARAALGLPFTRLFRRVIERAIATGEVLDTVDSTAVSEVFPALAFHRATALGLTVDHDFVVRVVDSLLLPPLQ